MCTDLNDLNKCCPKDDFPLSRIDKVVDSAAGCETMTLLDCFSRYHQIWLCQEDEGKKSFIMPFGTYCYLRMPEGLKNACPILCKMMRTILKNQLQRNVFTHVISTNTPAPRILCTSSGRGNHRLNYDKRKKKFNIIAFRQAQSKKPFEGTFCGRGLRKPHDTFQNKRLLGTLSGWHQNGSFAIRGRRA
jgi:hypothetical protein